MHLDNKKWKIIAGKCSKTSAEIIIKSVERKKKKKNFGDILVRNQLSVRSHWSRLFRLKALFNLSSILIYASMTMRARLRGAVGGGSARARQTYEALYLQMCACGERRLAARLDFPERPLRTTHANGWNKQIDIHSSLCLSVNPARTDMLSVGWNNIFFFFFSVPSSQRHSITPGADSCLKGREAAALCSARSSAVVHITLLDRIQCLILLSSSSIILIGLWAPH